MEKETDHLAEDCPCSQLAFPIRGNCVVCARNHREHEKHLPECMHDVLHEHIAALAKQVELGVVDERPTPEHWEERRRESEPGWVSRGSRAVRSASSEESTVSPETAPRADDWARQDTKADSAKRLAIAPAGG